MEPISSKLSHPLKRPLGASVGIAKSVESEPSSAAPKDAFHSQGHPLGGDSKETPVRAPKEKEPASQAALAKRAPTQSESVPVSKSVQNAPQVMLQEAQPCSDEIPSSGKTLAQIAAEVSSPKAPSTRRQLPKPPLDPGRRAGLLRRLGHGFLQFLTSDPLQPLQRDLSEINRLEKAAQALQTPAQFQAKTEEFKSRLAAGETLADIRNEAYAVARQASVKALGLRPYDCQVLGALAMDDGHIAEMRTGEGKTLTAVMPLYLNALAGKGAHLVTVNDTLAARDAQDMAPAFKLLGMSVGTVLEGMKVDQKRAGYEADITYTTDRALGFDYLRDRTAKSPGQRLQREPFFALIDEVDEVLIDEAQSPLIISAESGSFQSEYEKFNSVVSSLKPGGDYYIDRKRHSVWLSDSGYTRVENKLQQRALLAEQSQTTDPLRAKEISAELQQRENLDQAIDREQEQFKKKQAVMKSKPGFLARFRGQEWDETVLEKADAAYAEAQENLRGLTASLPSFDLFSEENDHLVRFLYSSLKAHALFKAGDDYTLINGKVEIVDQNKGRTSQGRRYNDGVHQALEAKEGVPIGDDQRSIASITYPNLFKKYPRLSGMSGTAKTSEAEFLKLYDLDVVPVPTNKPVIRQDHNDKVFQTLEEKYEAVASDASRDFFAGKPVLIGTLSVEHNEYVAKLLLEKGVPRESLQVLNADTVRGDKEGENEMIGQAGRSGVITVATSLAGRGANIKPDLVNFRKLAEASLVASSENKPVAVSLSKKKDAEWLQSWLQGQQARVVPADHPSAPQPGEIQIRYGDGAKAGETEPESQSGIVHLAGQDFPTGGLTVYGTERSSSRRIDDQLIGRSGRQGAPGKSQFYLSLEDDLLRIFAGDKLDAVLSHFTEPGAGVKSAILDTVIAQAQSSVEAERFAARESANKQDEVLNIQRETFFTLRDDLLSGGDSMRQRLQMMVGNAVEESVFSRLPDKERLKYGDIRSAVSESAQDLKLPIDLPFLSNHKSYPNSKTMAREDLELEIRDLIDRKTSRIMRTLQQTTGQAESAVRPLVLDVVDESWSSHLEQMELLRQGVGWQALAQKDPEVEFKLKAFELFGESISFINKQVATGLFKDLLTFAEVVSATSKTTH